MYRVIKVEDSEPENKSCYHSVKVTLMYQNPKGGWRDPIDCWCTRKELKRHQLIEKLFLKGVTDEEIGDLIELTNYIRDDDMRKE